MEQKRWRIRKKQRPVSKSVKKWPAEEITAGKSRSREIPERKDAV